MLVLRELVSPASINIQVHGNSCNFIVIVIVTVKGNVYGAVIVAVHCHCESSPGSFDECSTIAGWPPIFVPS